jgi:hypothetical protein
MAVLLAEHRANGSSALLSDCNTPLLPPILEHTHLHNILYIFQGIDGQFLHPPGVFRSFLLHCAPFFRHSALWCSSSSSSPSPTPNLVELLTVFAVFLFPLQHPLHLVM